MKEIGGTINIVIKVSDEVYDKYVDEKDGLCDYWSLMDDCVGINIRSQAELSWYEFDYLEEI